MRGNLAYRGAAHPEVGSIPACAGEPLYHIGTDVKLWVYPRVCGEPYRNDARNAGPTVYPRVCGGTSPPMSTPITGAGLSPRVRGNPAPTLTGTENSGSIPRVRGNHLLHRPTLHCVGSIPACAGEPASTNTSDQNQSVYPRVCGGTTTFFTETIPEIGLSPRVRGNRNDGSPTPLRVGSIPACAGEPRCRALPHHTAWVYPRVCGGTCRKIPMTSSQAGLSRVCGGTTGQPLDMAIDDGLSPRVRGNPTVSCSENGV